jgi:hypothetical protein
VPLLLSKGPDYPAIIQLKTEVRERLIRFSHTVNVFTLLHRSSTLLNRVKDFTCEASLH